MSQVEEVVNGMADAVELLLKRRITPIEQQVKELVAWRAAVGEVKGEKGEPGERGVQGERGLPGENVTADMLEAALLKMLPEMLAKAVEAEVERTTPVIVAKCVPLVPAGRDGLPGTPGRPGERGEDGRDGFSLEHFDAEMAKDGRTIVLSLKAGSQAVRKELRLPVVIDAGTYKPGAYFKGDGVTYGGSFWIAQKDTNSQPGMDDTWRLAVRRGKDGKDSL